MPTLLIMYFAPVSGKIILEPLHYFGQGLSLLGFDEYMKVIIHDIEVHKLKEALLFCFFGEDQEHSLALF